MVGMIQIGAEEQGQRGSLHYRREPSGRCTAARYGRCPTPSFRRPRLAGGSWEFAETEWTKPKLVKQSSGQGQRTAGRAREQEIEPGRQSRKQGARQPEGQPSRCRRCVDGALQLLDERSVQGVRWAVSHHMSSWQAAAAGAG